RDVGLDVLHGVVDREAGGDGPARRVDVEEDVLLRVFGLEEEQLRDDEVRDFVVDAAAEDDDPIPEEPRVDVVGSLTATRLLDDDWDQVGVHGRGLRLAINSTGITPYGQHLWAWGAARLLRRRARWPAPA